VFVTGTHVTLEENGKSFHFCFHSNKQTGQFLQFKEKRLPISEITKENDNVRVYNCEGDCLSESVFVFVCE
jgi:23S rRNA G2069 N7-methylase RlmK/C1962 C5-methylase RlmI